MKITVKSYQEKCELRRSLYYKMQNAENSQNTKLYFEIKEEYEELKEQIASLATVPVSFMIGCRNYYRNVVKIGKTYFTDSTKMTKSNGFRVIEEISSITEKMKEEMISDSYYY